MTVDSEIANLFIDIETYMFTDGIIVYYKMIKNTLSYILVFKA